MTERRRVEERGKGAEAVAGPDLSIVEKIPVPIGHTWIVGVARTQERTRLRKFRSPRPRKSARNPMITG
jgi:hypothetical protein